jgi:2-phospho-L-lactate guanylyltransferase (CobY/MobA/RfbA family)
VLWAVEPGEPVPERARAGVGSLRQEGAGLGERLYGALAAAARRSRAVAALGSDHPTVEVELVERAFAAVEDGADVALGPAEDGGYYLIALAAGAVRRRLFEDVPWSTSGVLAATLGRCEQLGLAVELLPAAADVDTPADLARLAVRLAPPGAAADGCPRTRALLARWRRLPGSAAPAAAREAAGLQEPIVAVEPAVFSEPAEAAEAAEPVEPVEPAGRAEPVEPAAPAAWARRGGGR